MRAEELYDEIIKSQENKFKKEFDKVIKAFKSNGSVKYEHYVSSRDYDFLEDFAEFLKSEGYVVSTISTNYDNDRNVDDYDIKVKLPKKSIK